MLAEWSVEVKVEKHRLVHVRKREVKRMAERNCDVDGGLK